MAPPDRQELNKRLSDWISKHIFDQKKKEIILRSKAVYIKAKRILRLQNSKVLTINVGSDEIMLDVETLTHILFRHFAPDTKQYDDGKSHFSEEVSLDYLLEDLSNILEKIVAKGFLQKPLPDDIFFKYYNRLYRVYFKKNVGRSSKEKGTHRVTIVSTWYPVEAEKDRNDAKILIPHKVDNWLYVLLPR